MKKRKGKRKLEGVKGKIVIGKLDDPIHPLQFWGNAKSRLHDPLLPEKRLWSAVLEDAFMCCVRGYNSGERASATRREDMEEAKEWFLDKRRDIGSFLWVCKMLDLTPGRILKKVPGLYRDEKKAA